MAGSGGRAMAGLAVPGSRDSPVRANPTLDTGEPGYVELYTEPDSGMLVETAAGPPVADQVADITLAIRGLGPYHYAGGCRPRFPDPRRGAGGTPRACQEDTGMSRRRSSVERDGHGNA